MNNDPTTLHERIDSSTSRKNVWPRRILFVLVGLVGTMVSSVLFAPSMLSSAIGTRLLLSVVNNMIGGSVHADDLSLGWFSGQWAEDLRLMDPDGNRVLAVKRIELPRLSLLSLLQGTHNLETVMLVKPVANIRQYPDGTNSLSRSLLITPSAATPPPTHKSQTKQKPNQSDTLLGDIRVTIEITDGRITYALPEIPPVELTDLSVSAGLMGNQRLAITFKSQIHQSNVDGHIEGKLIVREMVGPDGQLALAAAEIDSELILSNIPVLFADHLLKQQGKIAALLGPVFSGQLVAHGRVQQLEAKLWANSQNLKAILGIDADANGMKLSKESILKIRVTPQAWDIISQGTQWEPAKLAEPFRLNLIFNELSTGYGLNTMQGEAELKIGDIILDGGDARMGRLALRKTHGKLRLNGADRSAFLSVQSMLEQKGKLGRLSLTVQSTNVLDEQNQISRTDLKTMIKGTLEQMPVTLFDRILDTNGLAIAALGPTLDIQAQANLLHAAGLNTKTGSFTVRTQGQTVDASINGQITERSVTLEPDSKITLTLKPSFVRKLIALLPTVPPQLEKLKLEKSTILKLKVNHAHLPLRKDLIETARVDLQATIDHFIPKGDPRFDGVSLQDLSVQISNLDSDGSAKASLHVRILHHGQTIPLRATFHLNDPFTDKIKTHQAMVTIDNLPIGLIERLAQPNKSLTKWLAKPIKNITLETSTDLDGSFDIKARITSPQLTAYMSGRYQPSEYQLQLTKGSWVKYQITPQLFRAMLAKEKTQTDPDKPQLELDRPFHLKAVVHEAVFGLWRSPATHSDSNRPERSVPIDPSRIALKVSLTSEQAKLRLKNQPGTMRLKDLKASLQTHDLRNEIKLSARVTIDSGLVDSQTGSILALVRMENLFDQAGVLTPSSTTTDVNVKADRLPTSLLDTLPVNAMEGFEWATGLGPTASMNFHGRLSANQLNTVKLTANSSQADLLLSLDIDDQHILMPNDAHVRLTVTPKLSRRWLKRIHPFLNDAATSDKPIELVLRRDGFRAPAAGFSLEKVTANAILNLGTIRFERTGFLNTLRRIFKRDTSRPPVAIFTPMRIRLREGVISYHDMNMQMDNLQLEFRGQIDQIHDRVNMSMDIPGQTMAKAFDLQDIIEPGYKFSVPIGGTLDDPQIDFGAIATEIARLVAKSQLKKHGPWGGAAGDLLDQILQGNK